MNKPKGWIAPAEMAPSLINSIGLGQLITVNEGGEPSAAFMPFEAVCPNSSDISDAELIFHLPTKHARNKKDLLAGRTALALFTGAHGYISPRWYAKRLAPTWNFVSVQVKGVGEEISEEETLQHLYSLTDRHEAEADTPYSLDKVYSQEYMDGLLATIKGFRLPMTDVEVTMKLSQNRTPEELETIIDGLLERGLPLDKWLADTMSQSASEAND